MIRLSFIVPFYNVEPYIEECIRSLYDQDILQEEYEVICVDDCSPDGSRAIVERLQKEYPTLQLLIHDENKRQGGARNTGMKVAKGRYIWFIDSDDYIQKNCLKSLLEQAEGENLDVLQIYYSDNGKPRTNMVDYGPCTGSQYVFDAPMAEKSDQRCMCVCGGIIRRDLLLKNNIWFEEKVQYEDDDYAYLYFAHAQRVHVIPKDVYIVRARENSTTRSDCSVQSLRYMCQQVERVIKIMPALSAFDKRWNDLAERSIRWTCEGQILPSLRIVAEDERRLFYSSRSGHIKGLWKYVSVRTWLAMRYAFFYKMLYK